jgi:hypothetical protein
MHTFVTSSYYELELRWKMRPVHEGVQQSVPLPCLGSIRPAFNQAIENDNGDIMG